MNKRNIIYTGLLMLSLLTTPIHAADKSIEAVEGIANFDEGRASIVLQANTNQSLIGKSFRVYKLFNVNKSADDTSFHYTLNEAYASKIKELVSSKLNKNVEDQDVVDYMMSLNHDGNQSEYRKFIDLIQNAISTLDANVVHVTSCDAKGNITLDKLGYGFYLIDEVTDVTNTHGASSLTMVDTAIPTATLQLKSDYPSIIKKVHEDDNEVGWNDIGDFEINQIFQFKYETRVPDMSGYNGYFFQFEDEIDPALSYNESTIQVKVKDKILDKKEYSFSTTSKGFTITFNNLKSTYNIHKDDPIVLTYDAYINEKAARKTSNQGYENKVRLNFSNDPQSNSKGNTPWDTVVCYTYKVDGLKTNEKDVKLSGATFKLYRDQSLQDQVKVKKTVNGYVISDSQDVDIVSDSAGTFIINGLDQGTYYLKEIKAPDGYRLLNEAIEIQIKPTFVENRNNYTSNGEGLIKLEASSHSTTLNTSLSDASVTLKVINQTGSKMPVTGSFGTLACVITGAGIMVYVCKKKKEE